MKEHPFIYFLPFFLLLYAPPAHSCSCGGPYDTVFCQAVAAGRHIIRGKLVERTHPSFARVAVLENINRNIPHDTITIMGQDGVNCGENLYLLSEGAEYVLALIPLTGPDTLMLFGCSKNFYPISDGMVLGQIIPGLTNMAYETLRDNIADILACTFAGPSFVSEANRWNILAGWFSIQTGNGRLYTEIYRFQDTIQRNGQVYHKLWMTEDSVLQDWEYSGQAFREGPPGKVYKYLPQREEEELVYDFTLEPGEEIIYGGYNSGLFVSNVDFIQLPDGSLRRRMLISLGLDTISTVYWIEGIGSERSTFEPIGSFVLDAYIELLCYYQEEALLHVTDYADRLGGCYRVIVGTEEESNFISWEVFPNPATDVLSIVFRRPATVPLHLRLLNPLGQVVRAQRLPAFAERASWDVVGLAPGVYFVELLEEGKRVGGRKVVKH